MKDIDGYRPISRIFLTCEDYICVDKAQLFCLRDNFNFFDVENNDVIKVNLCGWKADTIYAVDYDFKAIHVIRSTRIPVEQRKNVRKTLSRYNSGI